MSLEPIKRLLGDALLGSLLEINESEAQGGGSILWEAHPALKSIPEGSRPLMESPRAGSMAGACPVQDSADLEEGVNQ